jgi:hypothetical protein
VESETGGRGIHGLDAAGGAEFHAGFLRGFEQAVDDGLRGIGDGKHATVGFGLELHASRREPVDRVLRLEAMKRSNECAPAARISLRQRARIEARVGDVAATAAGNTDFREKLPPTFKQYDMRAWAGIGTCDGREKSRRATTDNRESH